ncbi:MAG: UDP-3-O-(3-hydroxymyristoyl)glucosamine N-acyltransferase [Candidatus Adiutrix sp.]|jgi:UDP-3-O-[3-hydroxymyristoyl] glucosamine N-acyltransferase|nr:UDP-3-O-(3-hydroxymyristoyl)glucosamine N-acyltransferase [Candidatus Adiutrix sp.]
MLDRPRRLGELAAEASAGLKTGLAALGVVAEDLETASEVVVRGEPGVVINSLAAVDEVTGAGPGALTFAVAPSYLAKAIQAGASAVIVPPSLADESTRPALLAAEPRLIFAVLLGRLGRQPIPVEGEPLWADRATVSLGRGVVIGPGAFIGRGVKIGDRTVIGPQAFLGDGVEVGPDCLIHPRAVLRWGVRVGQRCQIHSGAVIGEDGFGYTQLPQPAAGRLIHYKNEHSGGVVLEDDVEVGANSAIDRGLVSDTVIGRGTKIDNLVQIGHNCRIGRDCLLVSQVGVAGHSAIGDRVFLLGQAGLGPGVTIGQDAIICAQAGVTGRIPPGRRLWHGEPARPERESLQTRALSASQLPKVRHFFQLLKKCASFEELKAAFLSDEGKESSTP